MKSRKRAKRDRKRHAGVLRMRAKCESCKKTWRHCRAAGTAKMCTLKIMYSTKHMEKLIMRESVLLKLLRRDPTGAL